MRRSPWAGIAISLLLICSWGPTGSIARAQEKVEPTAPAAPQGPTPESLKKFQKDFSTNMGALLKKYEAPPEVSTLFQGFADLMTEAHEGRNPVESFRQKSPNFFKDMDAMMQKETLPPEATNIMKSFMGIMQEALKAPPAAPQKDN